MYEGRALRELIVTLRSSESGTYKTVKARFWPPISGKSPSNLSSCSLFSRRRLEGARLFPSLNHRPKDLLRPESQEEEEKIGGARFRLEGARNLAPELVDACYRTK